MKISVISPMYNEEENLSRTFSEIKSVLSNNNYNDCEVIFVNDGSTDETWEKAKELEKTEDILHVIGYQINRGRGKALRYGFEKATGDIIVTIDFDLSYDASYIVKMIKELEENDLADVILTSAYMPGGRTEGIPFFRWLFSKFGNLMYRFAFEKKIYTSTCVVRAYRKEVLEDILLEEDGKEIHLEILTKILSIGYKIKEIPGVLQKRKKGKSKFKYSKTSISHLIYLFQEKPSLLFGAIGCGLMILGFISSTILLYTRFGENEMFEATLISRIVSPNFIIILFLSGLQMLGIGFIGIQNNALKRELFKIQKQLNRKKNDTSI